MSLICTPKEILDLFILIKLHKNGAMHGYALASKIEQTFGWKPSLTSIYNSLKDMAEKGYVSVEDKIEKGRVQKSYFLTKSGESFLRNHQQKFRKKLGHKIKQFFSMLANLENLHREDVERIIELLERILLLTIFCIKDPKMDLKLIESLLSNSLSSLEKIASEHKIRYLDSED